MTSATAAAAIQSLYLQSQIWAEFNAGANPKLKPAWTNKKYYNNTSHISDCQPLKLEQIKQMIL